MSRYDCRAWSNHDLASMNESHAAVKVTSRVDVLLESLFPLLECVNALVSFKQNSTSIDVLS